MIDRTHRLSVKGQAGWLGPSRASVYSTARPVAEADLTHVRRTGGRHLELPCVGSRMLGDLVVGEGAAICREHVRTLMRRRGITASFRRPRTTRRHRAHPVYSYLPRKLTIITSGRPTSRTFQWPRGFVDLVAFTDWASRKVLNWRLSPTLTSDCWVAALEAVLARYGCPEILNTDQGSQFTSVEFLNVLRGRRIAISMDGTGCWRDNVFVERLWRSVKYEAVYLHAYNTVSDVRTCLTRYCSCFCQRQPPDVLRRATPDSVSFQSPPTTATSLRAVPLIAAA